MADVQHFNMQRARKMTIVRAKTVLQNAAVILGSLIITLLMLEGALRIVDHADDDGLIQIGGIELNFRPRSYSSVAVQLEQVVENYMRFGATSGGRFVYHELTGWTHTPNYHRAIDGEQFTFNSAGIRSTVEYSTAPAPDVLRIALFGDSFTAGWQVSDGETWGVWLEQELQGRGINAEVLNFGVGGYGMDQAYLRWQSAGVDYDPDIVIFGFQPENMFRNLNIIRGIYRNRPGNSPFTKPRFALEDGELVLINSPTIPPEELGALFEEFAHHPLAAYERFYDHNFAKDTDIKILSVFYSALNQGDVVELDALHEGSDFTTITGAIVDAFGAGVEQAGAEFVIVHLPFSEPLRALRAGDPLPYQFMLDHFAEKYILVRPEFHFSAPDFSEIFVPPGEHYSPLTNRDIGLELANRIEACINNGECQLTRFESMEDFRG